MSHLFLNWTALDFAILIILLLSVVVSFFRGFLREAISLVTWFLAFFLALKLAPALSGLFHSILSSSPKARYILTVIIIFVIVLILGAIVSKLAHGLVTFSGLLFLDKLLGFVFGAARGVLFVTIILLIIQASPFQNADWAKQSQLSPHFQTFVARFNTLLPKEIQTVSSWVMHYASTSNQTA